jgi:magnesium transporter
VTAPAPAARPFSVWVRGTESRQDLSVSELANALRAADGELWVHIDSSVPAQVELLRSVFHFHPLAIEDTLNPMSRVKLEEYEGSYLFAIVRVLEFEERTADPYDLATTNLCFFLGQHYLVTVRNGPSPKVDAMCQQLHRNPELLGRGAERLMHAIMDSAIDAYFPILDQIDEFTHTLEERVFVTFDTGALHTIFRVKRLVLTLRRHLAPQREVFNILTNRPSVLISPEAQLYFRDIYDHVLRINDGLDTYRELLGSTLDAYLTQVSNRLALATKGLTVVATLSVPFVVVSGMWGMNFARIPLHDAPYGFWLLLGIQLLIGILLVGVLRWRRWL